MIKILRITEAKNEQAVIEIELNQQRQTHVLAMHLIYQHRLEEGQELTQTFYDELIKTNAREQLYAKALNYISYQMRTISEVKKHLLNDSKDERLIQQIIDILKQNNYLNDSQYVDEYYREKIEYDIVGPLYIKDKLIQKGIHYDLIDAKLIRYTTELEYAKMEDLITKDIRFTIKKPYRKYVESLKRKAITKGFHLDVIDNAIVSFKEDILAMIDDQSLLEKEIAIVTKNVDLSNYESKQKVIQKLLQKGFYYDRIKQYLD